MAKSTQYFAGLWRGLAPSDDARISAQPVSTRGKKRPPAPAVPYVMWNVQLIGEALSDRNVIASFEEKWFRKDRSLRCTRSGTMKFFGKDLVLRVRKNDCAKHWDELEKPVISRPTATTVVITLATGEIRYRWLRNSIGK